jgi:hypothetical protein
VIQGLARYVLKNVGLMEGVTYKQAQVIAQMTAGKRFWHKPKSATVGTAQTKLARSHDPIRACTGNTKQLTKIGSRSPSSHS